MFFRKEFADVVEWSEYDDSMIFYKFTNKEIKKNSKLIIKPGQDAIFLYNGKIEGIFKDDGEYDIRSDIIPFLSTLKGFKFGFNSGMRAEVLFINTKELEIKWGTRTPINIQTPQLKGGVPIRANGSLYFKVNDYTTFIEKIAGIRSTYYVEDVRARITSVLDTLLMKWVSKEGKDIFNLQVNAFDIANGIKEDLDMQIYDDGMSITNFNIMSFNYPEQIQQMINKLVSQSMIEDNMDVYTQTAMANSIEKGQNNNNMSTDMASMVMGMKMAEKMLDNVQNNKSENIITPKFCSECGIKTIEGSNFCSNCGKKF